MSFAHNLSHALNSYESWLKDLEEKPAIDSPDEAYAVMRAVLQTLRDRLPVDEAAHLSAQLPLIARGIFFEGWKPSQEVQKFDKDEFCHIVRERLDGVCAHTDTVLLTSYVFEVINHFIDPGEVSHVKGILPRDFQSLWPEQVAA